MGDEYRSILKEGFDNGWIDVYENKGKTSGSRIVFLSEIHKPIMFHKPHKQKEFKQYQIKQLIDVLEKEELI